MNLKIVCWNCRGAAKFFFHRICIDLCKVDKVDVLIILEPRCSGDKANKIVERLGFNSSWRYEAEGYSGGIWILWNTGHFTVTAVEEMKQCLTVNLQKDNQDFFLSCVYGSPNMKTRESLWAHIQVLSADLQHKSWAYLGDFNAYILNEEKSGGGRPNRASMRQIKECLDMCGLWDIGFSGPMHTWSNGRVKERLDRCVVNQVWGDENMELKLLHLNQLNSDHRPILLEIGGSNNCRAQHQPLFRFQSAWLTNESFKEVVKGAWAEGRDWNTGKETFVNDAKTWNKVCFGNIFRRKERIFRRLKGIDRAIAAGSSNSFDSIQNSLWKEYEDILIQEEIYWAQIARCNWLSMGDKNTGFFHESAKMKRKRLKIEMLKRDDGEWTSDQDTIRDIAVNYFKNLYSEEMNTGVGFLHGISGFPRLEYSDILNIQREPLDQEIKEVVFSMGSLKAPGPDGLHALFFQSQWDVVGKAVCEFVRKVFVDPSNIVGVNETMLVLIPKIDNPETINQFRPISLCNVIYKIVTKLISWRLKHHMSSLIGHNQSSFISGRNSYDNVIVAQEVVHYMERKKGKKAVMAIKVDLEKAYDRLRWDFIEDTLNILGFSQSFIAIIMKCISTPKMKIMWNGVLSEEFDMERGIRQGDSLSPYIFVLCMERLSHIINYSVEEKKWRPIKLSRGGRLFLIFSLLMISFCLLRLLVTR